MKKEAEIGPGTILGILAGAAVGGPVGAVVGGIIGIVVDNGGSHKPRGKRRRIM